MKTRLSSALIIALAAASAPAFASTELVTNGSFESYAGGSFSGYQVINAGSSALAGWTIGYTSVDVINGSYGAVSGNSIDMLGSPGPGSIAQYLATTAGQTYTLRFDLSQNLGGDNDAAGKALFVSFNGDPATLFTALYSGPGTVAHQTLSFTASSASTLLQFTSGAGGYSGAVLDNISVTAVPEPETYAMLLAGLGLMATIARRRKSMQA